MLLKAKGLYVFGPYRLDARERQLQRNGETVTLPPKAFDLLVALVASAGHLVTKEELLVDVWAGAFVEDANISYTISLLRKALGEEADSIETVPKVGYRFILPVSHASAAVAAIQPAATSQSKPWRVSRTVIAVVILLGLLRGSAWILSKTGLLSAGRPAEVTTVPVTSFGGSPRMPRLSPDGKYVVYTWDGRRKEEDPPNWDVYVQPAENGGPLRLTNDPVPELAPAWSPDGEQIAFLKYVGSSRYEIQVIPNLGGTPRTVSPPDVLVDASSIDWSPDGNSIVFSNPDASGRRNLALLSVDTKVVKPLTVPPKGAMVDREPRFSPDGQRVAFFRSAAIGSIGELWTIDVVRGREQRITSDGRDIQGVAWTADGKELVFSSNRSGYRMLWRIAADSSETVPRPIAGVRTDSYYPNVSRKGDRLAYYEERKDSDIWRASLSLEADASGSGVGLASLVHGSTRMDGSPQVSPDGRQLVFVSQRSGDQAIWVSDVDGQNPLRIATFPGHPAGSPRWSPTGTRVAFDAYVAGHGDIFVVGAQGGKPVQLTQDLAESVVPSWSRNEKWIYFSSNQTGRYEVWKLPSGGGAAAQVTRGGGFAPFESHDGRFVYYVKGIELGGIWRIPIEGGDETLVFDGPTPRLWGYWALLPGGVCFATRDDQNERASALVQYFDFGSKRTMNVGPLGAPAIAFFPFFAISPDGKSVFYVKTKPMTSDIMLVKNFR